EPSYATSPYARPGAAGTDTLTIAPPAPGAVPPAGGPPQPTTTDGGRGPGRTVALVLATALVAGGIGGGVGAAVAKNPDRSTPVTWLTQAGTVKPTSAALPTGPVE